MHELDKELATGIKALELASHEVLKIYNSISLADAQFKSDNSPVSYADKLSNKIISEQLQNVFEYPILSEESDDDLSRLTAKRVWIVDPLDGTYEFLSGREEFSINLALVEKGQVLMGIVAIPAKQEIYYACRGEGAFLKNHLQHRKIQTQTKQALANVTVAVSRSHLNPSIHSVLEKIDNCKTVSLGSSLKYCAVASGDIDITVRKTPLYEWDVAAADCILTEAGGILTNLDGEKIIYNQRKTLLEDGIIAANTLLHKLLLSEITDEV